VKADRTYCIGGVFMNLSSSILLRASRLFATSVLILALGCGRINENMVASLDEDIAKNEDVISLNAPGCSNLRINAARELAITDLAIVNDRRTAWQFKTLISNMVTLARGQTVPTNQQLDTFVRRLFAAWQSDQRVNSFTAPRRQLVQNFLNDWPKLPNTNLLDLDRAPFRLLAIFYRPDLKKTGTAGEGRFVFGLLDQSGFQMSTVFIFEYHLPIVRRNGVLQDAKFWATRWHELGAHKPTSTEYKRKLEDITNRFVGRNTRPAGVNGNALAQLRTNDFSFGQPWELREFVLSGASAGLTQVTVKQTPDISFNNSGASRSHLISWMAANRTQLLNNSFSLPETLPPLSGFSARPLLGASAPTNFGQTWLEGVPPPKGVTSTDWQKMTRNLSLATCSGCHAGSTQTFFLHVEPRSQNAESRLSFFAQNDLKPRAEYIAKDLGCRTSTLELLEQSRSQRVH